MQQDEEEDQDEMAGWRVHGPEKDGYKRKETYSKEPRDLEAYCSGGQGPPRAVAPSDDDDDDDEFFVFKNFEAKCLDKSEVSNLKKKNYSRMDEWFVVHRRIGMD